MLRVSLPAAAVEILARDEITRCQNDGIVAAAGLDPVRGGSPVRVSLKAEPMRFSTSAAMVSVPALTVF